MFAQSKKAARIYKLHRTESGDAMIDVVEPDRSGPLIPSDAGRRSSPSGFEWGYDGSGPFNSAHSILTDFLDFEAPRAIAMEYKSKVIATLPNEGCDLPGVAVGDFLDDRCGDRELLELAYIYAMNAVIEFEDCSADRELFEREMNEALRLVNDLAEAATGMNCPGVTDSIQGAVERIGSYFEDPECDQDEESFVECEARELVAGLLQLDQFRVV